MDDLTACSGQQLVHMITTKQVSCVEVMQAYLDRIAVVNPAINAMVQQLPAEQALAQAREADIRVTHKETIGPLHGLPISIKDGRKVKGLMCTLGNQSPYNFIPQEDATVVARLRAAGAIIIGITNIPDFSMSYETDNLLYGRTSNPYDKARSPGGSSGGEAAIIAAGGSVGGIGADSGGSIRQPAHNCGIAGLKPTRGLLPNTGHYSNDQFGIFNLVTTQGPMARYVDDLITMLPILAGPDGHDPNTVPVPVRDASSVDLKKLRIAFYVGNGVATPQQEIADTVRAAATSLLGHVETLTEDCFAVSKDTYTAFEELFFYGGDRGQNLRNKMQQMKVSQVAAPFQAILDRAQQCEFSVTELRDRLLLLDQFKLSLMNFMQNYDVIICPVATAPASLYEKTMTSTEGFELAYDLTYNLPYNITGWPAAVVRCGTSKEGLPIGVQVIAKAWRDDIALAVAKRLEETFGGWQAPLGILK